MANDSAMGYEADLRCAEHIFQDVPGRPFSRAAGTTVSGRKRNGGFGSRDRGNLPFVSFDCEQASKRDPTARQEEDSDFASKFLHFAGIATVPSVTPLEGQKPKVNQRIKVSRLWGESSAPFHRRDCARPRSSRSRSRTSTAPAWSSASSRARATRIAEPSFQLRDASAQPLNLLPQRPDQRILLGRRHCRQVRKPRHLQLESRPDSVVNHIVHRRCRRRPILRPSPGGLSNCAFRIPSSRRERRSPSRWPSTDSFVLRRDLRRSVVTGR
jgi:hypothetical protein